MHAAEMIRLYPENRELPLLVELSHELSNFRKGFKGQVQHTYVLDPGGSSAFGFDIVDGRPYLGVPELLFEHFMHIRWYLVNIMPNRPGLFLVFDMGVPPDNHPVALRLYLRTPRVMALAQFRELTVVKMDAAGNAFPLSNTTSFNLPVKQVAGLAWEKFQKA